MCGFCGFAMESSSSRHNRKKDMEPRSQHLSGPVRQTTNFREESSANFVSHILSK